MFDSWRVLAKNARINSEVRLVSLDRELSIIKFDFVLFSVARCGTQDVFVEGGHRLICFSKIAGVGNDYTCEPPMDVEYQEDNLLERSHDDSGFENLPQDNVSHLGLFSSRWI